MEVSVMRRRPTLLVVLCLNVSSVLQELRQEIFMSLHGCSVQRGVTIRVFEIDFRPIFQQGKCSFGKFICCSESQTLDRSGEILTIGMCTGLICLHGLDKRLCLGLMLEE